MNRYWNHYQATGCDHCALSTAVRGIASAWSTLAIVYAWHKGQSALEFRLEDISRHDCVILLTLILYILGTTERKSFFGECDIYIQLC